MTVTWGLALAGWGLAGLGLWLGASQAHGQPQGPAASTGPGKIFRCGSTYTNDPVQAQAAGCRLLQGSQVTVVEGTRVQSLRPVPGPSSLPAASSTSAAPGPGLQARIDAREQQARDGQAREILEQELQRALARQAELLREYNNGEPEKLGPETRNHQKYLDRVEQLKAGISRIEADIQGLRRELARLGASK